MKFISRILSYFLFFILLMFSILPFPVLYVLSDILAFLLFHVIGYRKKVVLKNLQSSFAGTQDVRKMAWRFYRFLADTFIESIKFLTIRKKGLLRRIHCSNPEVMQRFASEKRSVIFMSGHYGNWELLIYSMNLLFPHLAIGVGKPLTNKVLNKLINARRSKTGMKIINANNIREEFAKDKDTLTASLFLSDQYPGGVGKGYPATFLRKHTEFMYGAEKYAMEYNYPVVYADVFREKRGHYRIEIITISEKPLETRYGEIMSAYAGLMEKTILRQPEYWLWSHKRWKHLQGFY